MSEYKTCLACQRPVSDHPFDDCWAWKGVHNRFTEAEWWELDSAIIARMAKYNVEAMESEEQRRETAIDHFERLNSVRLKLGMKPITMQAEEQTNQDIRKNTKRCHYVDPL